MNRPVNHAYSYDYVRALQDLAEVLDNNPDLEPPSITLTHDEPQIEISIWTYPFWLNAADHIGNEALTDAGEGNLTVRAAVRFGDSVYLMSAPLPAGMTIREAERLLMLPSSIAKAV